MSLPLRLALPLALMAVLSCSDADDRAIGSSDAAAGQDAGVLIPPGEEADSATENVPPTAPEKPPFDWVGIVGTGQSLSVGAHAEKLISTNQPFHNGKLVDTGPDPKYPLTGGMPKYAIVPLVELIRPKLTGYADTQYPNNIYGETPHSGMANEISTLFLARTGSDYVTLHSVVGWSGRPLTSINKEGGMRAYPGSLMEARVFASHAAAAHKTFGYGAVVLTHGEADANNLDYGAGLKTFIEDYNTDLKAITHQTRDIVLLVSQQSVRATATSSAVQVWQAGVANPGKIICTGPKYQYGYFTDFLHMPAPGYRRLGEKYAEVYDLVVNQGKGWKPLQPKTAVRDGAKIVLTFDVPNPPIEWDATLAPNHQTVNTAWAKGHGFEARSAAGAALSIASAEITAPDAVTLTLTAVPAGAVTVGYAVTEDGTGDQGGLVTGYRGQLRDSDTFVGYDEETLTVTFTKGSAKVTLTGASNLDARAVRDVVTGDGVPANFTVVSIDSAKQMTMSAPWPGASGAASVKVHYDQHNYAVHASLVVP